jgi:hypothetical protein
MTGEGEFARPAASGAPYWISSPLVTKSQSAPLAQELFRIPQRTAKRRLRSIGGKCGKRRASDRAFPDCTPERLAS